VSARAPGPLGVLARGLLLSLALPLVLAVIFYTRDPVPEWCASAVLGAWAGCAAGLIAWSALEGPRRGDRRQRDGS
jgi:hypothetical protein